MDSQWLNKQFELFPHKTKAGLAEALGLEPPAVSKILKGMRQIKAKEYAIMRRYFGLPVDGQRAVSPAKGKSQESLNYADVLKDSVVDTPNSAWIMPQNNPDAHSDHLSEALKIYKITDKFMAPDLDLGDYVLIDLLQTALEEKAVYILYDGQDYAARYCVSLSDKEGDIEVSAYSPAFATQHLNFDDVEIVGRVIAKLDWF